MTPPATHAALQSSPATAGTALEQAVGLVAGELAEVEARLEQLLQSSVAIIPACACGSASARPSTSMLKIRFIGHSSCSLGLSLYRARVT